MPKNELEFGKPRLGWMIDGNPDTDQIAVMLEDTGKAIQLTVPLRGMTARNDLYRRWWSKGVSFGDDPEKTRYDYKPPRSLLVHDNHGTVVLVGCRAVSYSQNLHSGNGQIIANYAVLGGTDLIYDKLHGVRTEIPGWNAWTGLTAMQVEPTYEANLLKTLKMTLASASEEKLSRQLNLTMKPRWGANRTVGSFRADEGVRLTTKVSRPRSWDEHLRFHNALLDLVSISAWKKFGFSSIEVCRTDDPERAVNGRRGEERWFAVATHKAARDRYSWEKQPYFLFPYSELGTRAVERWLRLRTAYSLALGPLLNILRSDDPWSDSSAVQSGIALESLGYLIDTEKNNGANLNDRDQISFNTGLDVILNDMRVKPFEDTESWKKRSNATYMGLKHADRPTPDALVMLNTLRENLLILRFWVAQQLGVPGPTLEGRLRDDPLAHAFELAD